MSDAPKNPLQSVEPWDLVAQGYDEVNREVMQPFSARAVELLAPRKHERAVDVACGPGTTSFLLAPLVEFVDAIDFSNAMLEAFTRHIARANVGHVRAVQGDGQALPYADGSFEVGVSMFGLMFFPDRRRGFAELCRVLVPGGRAVVSSWAPVDLSPAMELLFGALRSLDSSRPAPQRDATTLENPVLFEEEMRSGGFSSVTIEEFTSGVPGSTPEEFWNGIVRGAAPLVLLRRRVGEEAWSQMSRGALEYLEKHWDGSRPLTTTAYLAYGVK